MTHPLAPWAPPHKMGRKMQKAGGAQVAGKMGRDVDWNHTENWS